MVSLPFINKFSLYAYGCMYGRMGHFTLVDYYREIIEQTIYLLLNKS